MYKRQVLGGSVLGGGMMGLTERLFPGVFQNQYQLLFLLVVALGLLMTGLKMCIRDRLMAIQFRQPLMRSLNLADSMQLRRGSM